MQWNQLLLNLQATPGAQPATTHPTYELAIMHAAIYDAVVSIHHSAPPYPGAHATVSAAAAAVLARLYGNNVAFAETSPALPGVERSFTSFAEAADEATVSRIYNGNHTRIDEAAGVNLGRDVVDFALGHGLSAHGGRSCQAYARRVRGDRGVRRAAAWGAGQSSNLQMTRAPCAGHGPPSSIP